MKKVIYLLIALALLSSCATGAKAKPVSKSEKVQITVSIPPAGIKFTEFDNFSEFASIQMPLKGRGFGAELNYNTKTDGGDDVPSLSFKGNHIIISNDLSNMIKIDGDKSDINIALESFKNSFFLKNWLKKDDINEHYSDVEIAGKTCKRFYVSYNFTKDDFSAENFTLGYIIPYNNMTAFFFIDKAKSTPEEFEDDVIAVDSAFRYMIETVEFR